MNKYSRKQTKGTQNGGTAARSKNMHVSTAKGTWNVRSASTGRFTGMAQNLEKIEPVVISGYKVRG